jgi:hypothetical protein
MSRCACGLNNTLQCSGCGGRFCSEECASERFASGTRTLDIGVTRAREVDSLMPGEPRTASYTWPSYSTEGAFIGLFHWVAGDKERSVQFFYVYYTYDVETLYNASVVKWKMFTNRRYDYEAIRTAFATRGPEWLEAGFVEDRTSGLDAPTVPRREEMMPLSAGAAPLRQMQVPPPVEPPESTPLIDAVKARDWRAVMEILRTPVVVGTRFNNGEDADIRDQKDAHGKSAMTYALDLGDRRIIDALKNVATPNVPDPLSPGAMVRPRSEKDAFGYVLLSVERNDIGKVQFYLNFYPENIRAKDSRGRTALHHAFGAEAQPQPSVPLNPRGSLPTVNTQTAVWLIRNGAPLDTKDSNGLTPIDVYARQKAAHLLAPSEERLIDAAVKARLVNPSK